MPGIPGETPASRQAIERNSATTPIFLCIQPTEGSIRSPGPGQNPGESRNEREIKVKPIKMLGLAALAALAAMAFVGASSAMAEPALLCKADESPCSAENLITHVHETQVGKAQLLSEPTVECEVVLFLGDTSAAQESGGTTEIVGKFTYEKCNNSCTVKEEEGPATIKVLRTESELATVTGKGLVHLTCFFGFLNCRYTGEGLEGHGLGPLTSASENGSVVIEEQETKKESGTCPASAFLDLTTTPLIKTYISKGLHYCVKYEHNTNGRYKESCKTNVGSNSPEDLVVGPSGWTKNKMVCVNLNVTKTGLWKEIINSLECKNDSAELSKSLYELGEIILVE
jgi:hypothetical protein